VYYYLVFNQLNYNSYHKT